MQVPQGFSQRKCGGKQRRCSFRWSEGVASEHVGESPTNLRTLRFLSAKPPDTVGPAEAGPQGWKLLQLASTLRPRAVKNPSRLHDSDSEAVNNDLALDVAVE